MKGDPVAQEQPRNFSGENYVSAIHLVVQTGQTVRSRRNQNQMEGHERDVFE